MITALAIMALGSAIAGGSNSARQLIGGRAIQGFGFTGINILMHVAMRDLLRLPENEGFLDSFVLFAFLASACGAFLGGILVDHMSWRWVFYLQTLICGLCLVLLQLFLCEKRPSSRQSTKEILKKIDFRELLLILNGQTPLLAALAYGGTRHDWSDPSIVISLIMGVTGMALFMFYNFRRLLKPLDTPKALFNRTSIAALLITFMNAMVSYVAMYFLPIYCQAVQRVSVSTSGEQIIPFKVGFAFGAMFGIGLANGLGRFRNVHAVSFALQAVSFGSFTLLDRNSNTVLTLFHSFIVGVSVGMPGPSLLMAIQADVPDSLNAACETASTLVENLANILSMGVFASVFGNRFDQLLATTDILSAPAAQAALAQGLAYETASPDFINSFPPEIQDGIITLYELSLKRVWHVSMAFSAASFLFVLLEKNLVTKVQEETTKHELQDRADNMYEMRP